jgi:hypothetical protein
MTRFLLAFLGGVALLPGQTPAPRPSAAELPTANLLSEPGPTFRVEDRELPNPLTFIVYGDQRFTDPGNTRSANPRVRQWLAGKIAAEKPGALILNGDVPLRGDSKDDYAIFKSETKPWRDVHLRVFPALGNHEFAGDPASSLENWWENFPQLKNRRWYSVQLGSRLYVLAIDSNASLTPGSPQARWIGDQIDHLPPTVDFLVLTLHHPPVADIQKHIEVDHNPGLTKLHCANIFQKRLRSLMPEYWCRRVISTTTSVILPMMSFTSSRVVVAPCPILSSAPRRIFIRASCFPTFTT